MKITYLGPLRTSSLGLGEISAKNLEQFKLEAFSGPIVPTFDFGVGEFSGFIFPDGLIGRRILGDFDVDASEPIRFPGGNWVFRKKCFSSAGKLFSVDVLPSHEIELLIKHEAYKRERAFAKLQKEVAAFENFETLPSARRERISDSVRLFVWQRDSGCCVKCGSKKLLEFDHIIPVVEGGSNTERNIQLLCESCNRSKGRTL